MLPIIQRELVDTQGWLQEEDFVDMIGLVQSAPGPIAVNSAVYLGYRLHGISGAAAATLGVTIPSLLTIMAVAWALSRYNLDLLNRAFAGIRPAVVALIAYAAWKLGRRVLHGAPSILLTAAATVLVAFAGWHPAPLIVVGATLGLVFYQPGRAGDME